MIVAGVEPADAALADMAMPVSAVAPTTTSASTRERNIKTPSACPERDAD
jgi:hypothetical protein